MLRVEATFSSSQWGLLSKGLMQLKTEPRGGGKPSIQPQPQPWRSPPRGLAETSGPSTPQHPAGHAGGNFDTPIPLFAVGEGADSGQATATPRRPSKTCEGDSPLSTSAKDSSCYTHTPHMMRNIFLK